MEELLSPCSSFLPPPPPPQLATADENHYEVLEFTSCEVPDQWLLGDVVVAAKSEEGDYLWPEGSWSLSPDSELPPASLQASTKKRRGRKPGPRPEGPTPSHVEAERQRRDKLNRRFCDLRAAVPTVSRMDRASLLADAADYIAELRSRVAQLEDEGRQAAASRWDWEVSNASASSSRSGHAGSIHHPAGDDVVEVRMVGKDAAAVRVTSAGGAPHAPARLMGALRSLELQVQHACVNRVEGVTVQDVVVDVPAALQDDGVLQCALLQRLRDNS
ncbi:transcription factor bHLH14-like [Triticum dicoccoides]|uniref:transcription factor bHLH14-like n=1 Tax=Triticum dicoccoides TaxID=85692 RepID=UPI0018900A45|nr:transcription factor bHLH14-like [Triticum dicoccoides]XP_044393456.1 transcription factor bHLH14-like [Triticum aestivum]